MEAESRNGNPSDPKISAASGNEDPPTTHKEKEKGCAQGNNKEKRKENGGKTKKEARNEKSTAWDHFTRDATDTTYVTCDYCLQRMKCPSKNGTTSLRNHITRCKKYPYNADKKQKLLFFQNQSSVQDTGDSNSAFVTWKFDQDMCRKYCARMIIPDELSFKTVEHEGFRDLGLV